MIAFNIPNYFIGFLVINPQTYFSLWGKYIFGFNGNFFMIFKPPHSDHIKFFCRIMNQKMFKPIREDMDVLKIAFTFHLIEECPFFRRGFKKGKE